jgi:hypothetical protein
MDAESSSDFTKNNPVLNEWHISAYRPLLRSSPGMLAVLAFRFFVSIATVVELSIWIQICMLFRYTETIESAILREFNLMNVKKALTWWIEEET